MEWWDEKSQPLLLNGHRKQDVTVDQLREMLARVTWGDFFRGRGVYMKQLKIPRPGKRPAIVQIKFVMRIGLHLGRPAMAITSLGKYVVLQYIKVERNTALYRMFYSFTDTEEGFIYTLSENSPRLSPNGNRGINLHHVFLEITTDLRYSHHVIQNGGTDANT
jgi:hypothetical protein